MLEHDHIRLRRKLEFVLSEWNSIPANLDIGDVYLERVTAAVVAIQDEAEELLERWKNFNSSKNSDIEYKEECIKELTKLVEDIEVWFECNECSFECGSENLFEFDNNKDTWHILFEGKEITIGNKSGLIQLASIVVSSGQQVDLNDLTNNAMRPSHIGLGDDNEKENYLKLAEKGDGYAIDYSRPTGFEGIKNDKEISEVFYALTKKINETEQSALDFVKKYTEIEDMLEKFAKYIGKKR